MAVCVACGRELRPEWKFCVWCGAPVARTAPPTAADPAAPAEPAEAIASPPPATRPIEPLAIIAIVLAVLCSPFALVFGHAAIARIHRTRRRGRMAAIIATTLGYGWTVLAVAVVLSLVLAPRG